MWLYLNHYSLYQLGLYEANANAFSRYGTSVMLMSVIVMAFQCSFAYLSGPAEAISLPLKTSLLVAWAIRTQHTISLTIPREKVDSMRCLILYLKHLSNVAKILKSIPSIPTYSRYSYLEQSMSEVRRKIRENDVRINSFLVNIL